MCSSDLSDDIHLAREVIKPRKGIPLVIGLDPGMRRPAGVILQQLPDTQWICLGEVVPGRCGAKVFARALKREIAELAEIAGVDRLDIGSMYSDPFGFTAPITKATNTPGPRSSWRKWNARSCRPRRTKSSRG